MEKQVCLLATKELNENVLGMLKAGNFELTTIPFIEIKKLPVEEKIATYSQKRIWAVFTSSNAVEAVFTYLPKTALWRFLVLDGKTKKTLLRFIKEEQIIATALNGKDLAGKIISQPVLESLVFFCGNRRLATIPTILTSNHIPFEELVVYETVASPSRMIGQPFDGILFFSPSAVESFFSVNKVAGKTVFFAVGETTEKAIKQFTENKIITAQYPSEAEVIRNVIQYRFSF